MKKGKIVLCSLCSLCIFLSTPISAYATQSADLLTSSDSAVQATVEPSQIAQAVDGTDQGSQTEPATGATEGESDIIGQQGTEGDELQVDQAAQMEIDLGADYAGLEFMLETDFGTYPDPVMVDADGVLRLEVGGSSFYRLTNLGTYGDSGSTQSSDDLDQMEEQDTQRPVIPLRHLVIFAVGGCLAVAGLLLLEWEKRKKQQDASPTQEPEDDEFSWQEEETETDDAEEDEVI